MAVFFKNDCKFNGCGKTFSCLPSLIEHIEAVHIDFDPKVTTEFEEQHPVGIPLSYVLKYSHCRHQKETTSSDIRIRLFQHATKSVLEKHNGFGHQMDVEESFSESDSSNDSWTPTREGMSDRKIGAASFTFKDNKPFACSVPGCKKRYKNVNGIKYHYKNGHKIFEKQKKNSKQAANKRNKESSLKMSSKKLSNDEPLMIQMPSTSKTAHSALRTPDYIDLRWIEENSMHIEEKAAVPVVHEQADALEKHLPSSLHANNNNEFHSVCCTSTFDGNQWPASGSTIGSVIRNELTIIRPPTQNNDLPNNFVNYFDCNTS